MPFLVCGKHNLAVVTKDQTCYSVIPTAYLICLTVQTAMALQSMEVHILNSLDGVFRIFHAGCNQHSKCL